MLVICAGLQKSGSALCFNIINDLLVSNGYSDVRDIRKKYGLEGVMIQDDCYIHDLNLDNFHKILPPLNDGHSFVIKTHSFPQKDYFEFIKDNVLGFDIKYIYTYRDPRDVVLSTLDHRTNEPSTFDDFDTFANAIVSSVPLLVEALKWKSFKKVKLIRYEDFNNNIGYLTNSIQEFLDLPVKPEDELINNRYDKNNIAQWDDNTRKFGRLHFNKGISSRYLSELDDKELGLMESCLKYYIEELGYTTVMDNSDNQSKKLALDLTEFLGSLRSKDTLINTLLDQLQSKETRIEEERKKNTALQSQLDVYSSRLEEEKNHDQQDIQRLDQELKNQQSISDSLIDELNLIKSSHTYRILQILSTPFSFFRKRP